MQRRTKIISIATGALLAVTAAGGVAVAQSADDDQPLTGATYDRAVAAALEHTGGGEVTETEVGDDGAAYEVEVKLADGSQVEVNLDQDFTVLGSEVDDDGAEATETATP